MNEKQPIYVLPDNVSRTLGKDAQRTNILAAKVVADIVKTTLGPKGMDKMLVDSSGNIIVTNDGVTILEEMEIDHPAAKMIVEIAKTQEAEVGDGTTTVALLAGKLLENAEKLLDRKIHPTVIVKGYKMSSEKSREILNEIALNLENRDVLKQIAMTAMTGKGAEGHKEHLSELIAKAVDRVASDRNISEDYIKIQKIKGSGISESELIEGVVIDKERANIEMPSFIKDAKILIVDFSLELLDFIHRLYESEESIKILTELVVNKLFTSLVVIQVLIGMLLPLGIMILIKLLKFDEELRKLLYFVSAILIQLGIFATRWNVVIGGQMFSKSFRGLTTYKMDIIGIEGLFTTLVLLILPIIILAILIKILPPWKEGKLKV